VTNFKQFSSFDSVDGNYERDRIIKTPGESNQKEFAYFCLGGARMVNVSFARMALITVSHILRELRVTYVSVCFFYESIS
jgi:hypothetical protein